MCIHYPVKYFLLLLSLISGSLLDAEMTISTVLKLQLHKLRGGSFSQMQGSYVSLRGRCYPVTVLSKQLICNSVLEFATERCLLTSNHIRELSNKTFER